MELRKLFRCGVVAALLGATAQAGAAAPDFISGIPNHLDDASFMDRIQQRTAASPGMSARPFPVQWVGARTIITVSHHATFAGNESHAVKAAWFYLPPAMDARHWALFGAVLMLVGMLARSKTMPRV